MFMPMLPIGPAMRVKAVTPRAPQIKQAFSAATVLMGTHNTKGTVRLGRAHRQLVFRHKVQKL